MFVCLLCQGELIELGTLGHTEHFRCQDCGLDLMSCNQCGDDGEDPSIHCQFCDGSGVVENTHTEGRQT